MVFGYTPCCDVISVYKIFVTTLSLEKKSLKYSHSAVESEGPSNNIITTFFLAITTSQHYPMHKQSPHYLLRDTPLLFVLLE